MFNIVLFEPQIPQNTGNIVRTCAATGAYLHLIKPLGFSTKERELKRAGLDYWAHVNIKIYENFQSFLSSNEPKNIVVATKHGNKTHSAISYEINTYLLFGNETSGLPKQIRKTYAENSVRIPMLPNIRCLNLSNAVSILIYEAMRQLNYPKLS